MDDINFDTIYNALRNLIYYHTELTIWMVICTASFLTLRSMYYSLEVRRFMAVILLLSGLTAYGIYNFVFNDTDRNILAQSAQR